MGMTIHPVHAGNGWRYYMVETASHDEARSLRTPLADYYLDSGNPPAVWEEYRAKALGLDRRPVSEGQMHNVFQLGHHPDTGRRMGQEYSIYRSVDERVNDRLEAEPGADPARREAIRSEEQAKGVREAVAGFDLCFAPVKSVSVLWGIADNKTRKVIETCHDEARRDALEWLIEQAVYTRRGRDGIAHAAVDSVTTAVFMHRTSRSGDPHLHTHTLLSNKVRTADDEVWRAIHGDLLFKAKVATSERYNSRIEALLADRLGVGFVESGRDIREIDGIPSDVLRRFASRRVQVESRTAELLNEYRAKHGRDPDPEVEYRLAQQATLETRPNKKRGTTPISERQEWRGLVAEVTGEAPEHLVSRVTGHTARASRPDDPELVRHAARSALEGVQARRAQWTVMHLRAEAERVVRRLEAPAGRHGALVDQVVTDVLADPHVVALTPSSLVSEPDELRLPNGDPVWRTTTTHRYTTTTILAAEMALVEAARASGAPTVGPTDEALVLLQLAGEGHELADDQAAAVSQINRSGTIVDLLVAPAGAGKSHTMTALSAVWAATTGQIIALAPTARAARVLAESAGLEEIAATAHTIDKWLHESRRGAWALQGGDLVIVDEAGMASTPQLDSLRRQVVEAGAKLVLVGDHRQLAAVGAGGALRHLYHEAGAVELTSLWRFTDAWEALATVRLRDGDLSVIDEYLARDRVHTGTSSKLIDELYDGWRADRLAGHSSVMLAVSNRTVAQLNQRARRDLISHGTVDPEGVSLANGTTAGIGDTIVTRQNRSDLRIFAGKDWVHNGDLWRVDEVHDDGSLTVTHADHSGRLRLPTDYVVEHVDLGYASTVARAQGITVDTARVLVDSAAMDRANLYVALTRGRHLNQACLVTEDEIDMTIDRPRHPERAAWDMLAAILEHESDLSATEQLHEEQDTEWGLPALTARYEHVCAELRAPRYRALVTATVGADEAEDIFAADAWDALQAQFRRLEHHGHDPADILDEAYQERSLTDAVDPGAVLHHRIERRLGDEATGGSYLGLSPAPSEEGPVGDWAREMHAHITEQLADLTAADLTQPWADKLRTEHVPDDLVEAMATWRALHAVDDEAEPLGARPAGHRSAPNHRTTLAGQLDSARSHAREQLEELRQRIVEEPPSWTAWLGDPATVQEDRRDRWCEAVAHIALWRDQHEFSEPDRAWPSLVDPPAEIRGYIAQAADTANGARKKLATTARNLGHARSGPGPTHDADASHDVRNR
jgi:conjugative relaxase-like TrwC/TraI family protein